MGLGHETRITNPTPVMYPMFAPGEVQRTLTPDDIAGRDAIYGAPSGWALVPGGASTPSAPAATVFKDNLGTLRAGDRQPPLRQLALPNGQWTGWAVVPGGASTPSTPAATVLKDNLGSSCGGPITASTSTGCCPTVSGPAGGSCPEVRSPLQLPPLPSSTTTWTLRAGDR